MSENVPQGNTPLHRAVRESNENKVIALLLAGTPVDARGDDGKTPLHLAVKSNLLRITHLLLAFHADAWIADAHGDTPLHLTAMHGLVEMVDDLLLHMADGGANVQNVDRNSPLHLATRYGHLAIIELLLKQGARIDMQSANGQTALHLAVMHGEKRGIDLLLRYGAQQFANTSGKTPLHYAVAQKDAEITELLLATGADAQAADRHGRTPLHDAAVGNVLPCAKLLLARGADPLVKDLLGRTPLHQATTLGFKELALLLQQHRPSAAISAASIAKGAGSVTPQQEAEMLSHITRVEHQAKFYEMAFDALTENILIINHEQRVAFINKSASKNWRLPGSEVTGRTLLDLAIDKPYLQRVEAHCEFVLQNGRAFTATETVPVDGSMRQYIITTTPLLHKNGTVIGAICAARALDEGRQ